MTWLLVRSPSLLAELGRRDRLRGHRDFLDPQMASLASCLARGR